MSARKIVTKIMAFGASVAAAAVMSSSLAFAHVVVRPNTALSGSYETFTVSVPNEKDIPVTGVRLVIPGNVESVTPTVKPGWEISTKKTDDKVTEISWTGGTIPADQRDDFTFSAHLSSQTGDVQWDAYQTYQDGSVVSWDQKPAEGGHHEEDESRGPYSTTMVTDVVDDADETKAQTTSASVAPLIISIVAVALGIYAVVRTSRK